MSIEGWRCECTVGPDEFSARVEEILIARGTLLFSNCFVLRIEDDLDCTDVDQYKTAKMFRQCFPTDTLPAVLLITKSCLWNVIGERP